MPSPGPPVPSQHGFTLIEMLMSITVLVIITGATLALLQSATKAQSRDQAYASEITSTQTALSRAAHDLRQATLIEQVTPSVIQFQMNIGGTAYRVRYDCAAPDSLGSAYRRCARTSAPVGSSLPSYTAKVGSLDIQHVINGNSATFCNTAGSAQAGVFLVSNPAIQSPSGGALACDEGYETIITSQLSVIQPSYVEMQVQVPASGDLVSGGMNHRTVLQNGTFLPNVDQGA